MSVTPNLDAYVEVMTAQIHQLPPDAATRGEYTPQRENIRRHYYVVDLYLKQLAGYLIAEMRRQRLGVPKEWSQRRPLLAPLVSPTAARLLLLTPRPARSEVSATMVR